MTDRSGRKLFVNIFVLFISCLQKVIDYYPRHYLPYDPGLSACPPALAAQITDILHKRGYAVPELLERFKTRTHCNFSQVFRGKIDGRLLTSIKMLTELTDLRLYDPFPATKMGTYIKYI